MIRQNEADQERVRERLAKMGGPLRPRRNGFHKSQLFEQQARFGTPVELKIAPGSNADWAGRGLTKALEACGFKTRTSKEDVGWDGVHVESRAEDAATALVIQGAFRIAGFGAGLTIHDRAAARRVVVHVGSHALDLPA
jgi:hypothetical protein